MGLGVVQQLGVFRNLDLIGGADRHDPAAADQDDAVADFRGRNRMQGPDLDGDCFAGPACAKTLSSQRSVDTGEAQRDEDEACEASWDGESEHGDRGGGEVRVSLGEVDPFSTGRGGVRAKVFLGLVTQVRWCGVLGDSGTPAPGPQGVV